MNLKLEHCNNSGTNYSNAKIQASLSSGGGFTDLASSVTFTHTNYQEYCYTLSSPARYIKVSDNGNCAFRVDYVEYTTPASSGGEVTYTWTGPGIVGSSTDAQVTVDEAGTYIVVVYDCGQCTASDTVVVTGANCGLLVWHNVPANTTAECSNIPGVPGNVYASNDCDPNIEVVFSETTNGTGVGTGCNYTIVRTWTATDPCGVTDTKTQTITVVDTTAPVFPTQTTEYDLGCNESVPMIEPQVTDNCDQSVTLTYADVDNCEDGASDCDFKTYTPGGWGAPANGNNPGTYRDANFDAAFPTDLTVGCGLNTLTLTSAAAVEAFLPAGGTPAALTQDYVDPGSGFHNNLANHLVALTLATTFDAYDPNFAGSNDWLGEGVFGSGTFSGMTIAEVMQIANDVLGGCSNAYAPSELVEALAGVNENFDGGSNGGFIECTVEDPACYCTVVRTWTATDNCNNQSTFTQYFNVGDNFGPVASEDPSDVYVECGSDIPDAPVVTWTDDCGEVVEQWFCEEIVVVDECEYQIIRMWHANDGCQVTYVDQTIFVNDNTAPVIYGVPANATVECGTDIMDAVVWATDNCDNDVTISASAETIPQECGYLFVRTWTAEDNCGNISYAYQTITVVDTTDPYQTNETPSQLTVECDEDVPAFNPTFADICDAELTLTAISGITNVTECSYDIERAVSATDDCGNSITVTQVVHVADFTAPWATYIPADVTIECDQPTPTDVPTFADNCDENLDIYPASSIIPQDCGYLIHQSWQAVDNCGNEVTVSRNITVVDTTPPALIMPTNTSVNETCEEGNLQILLNYNAGVYSPAEVAEVLAYLQGYFVANGLIPLGATDNCDENPTWSETQIIVQTEGLECPVVGKITCV
ncbi:MAG: hypothetical protein JNM00_06785, partial [Flavobacteriales bacterium]|nr:hypothetical protein [Flavobacteriales bacterium]